MWWMALALAGSAEAVQKLMDSGKLEAAQKKCTRTNAWLSDTDPALREVCAEAMWPAALADGSFATWVRFQADWAGTQKAKAAFDKEAEVRLVELGEQAAESQYGGFLKKYGETPIAPKASLLQARAAYRAVETDEDAKRVARVYPDGDGLDEVVRRFFDAFVAIEIEGEDFSVRLEPEVTLPGALLKAEWAVRWDAGLQPWRGAAIAHLDAMNIPRETTDGLRRTEEGVLPYPPCDVSDGQLGVRVTFGELEAFRPVSRPCGGADPAFAAVRDGALVGLTLRPGISYRFATRNDSSIHWVDGATRARVPLLGEAVEKVQMVGSVLGQQVGRTWLLHPLSGGMPWYVLEGPPASALALPSDPASAPIPDDVRMAPTAEGDTRIERGSASEWTRALPSGDVRVLAPLFQRLAGLDSTHDAFKRVVSDRLPAGFVPEGGPPVAVTPRRKLELEQELGDFKVQVTKAWQLQLHPDPKLEIVFEGRAAGVPVRGVVDPKEGSASVRVFFYERPEAPGDPVVFRYQGRTWFAWKGAERADTLHYDGRGLVRSWTAP